MAASVCMKSSKVLMPKQLRPVALTIPWITVSPTSNKWPIASTTLPTRKSFEESTAIAGSLPRHLKHGEIGLRVDTDELRLHVRLSGAYTSILVASAMT
jgi:hypothetical protein